MIKQLAACVTLALCLGLSGRAMAGGNLVVNGGFETGDFSDWLVRGDSVFTFVGTDLPHSGRYAADLGTSVQGGVVSIEQNLNTIPGKPYILSFWLENDGGTPNAFDVSITDQIVFSMVNAPAFGYTLYTIPFSGSFFEATLLQFDAVQLPNYYHLDDISVVAAAAVPEPGTWYLAICGIVCGVPLVLHYHRRRQPALAPLGLRA